MSESTLDRSVLESKDRDDLVAIAAALSLKVPARAKKADLVTSILVATGNEAPSADEAAAKPRRATKKAVADEPPAAPPADADPADVADEPVEILVEEPTAEAPAEIAPAVEAAAPSRLREVRDVRQVTFDADLLAEPTADEEASPARFRVRRPAPAEAQPEPVRTGPSSDRGDRQRQERAQAPRQNGQPNGNGNGGNGNGNGNGGRPQQPQQNPARQQQGNQGQQGGQGQQPQPQAGQGQGQQPQQQGGQSEQERFDVDGTSRRSRRRRGKGGERLTPGYDREAQAIDERYQGDLIPCEGLLELRPEGFGMLRTTGYLPSEEDVYVSTSQVRKCGLRAGDRLVGASRPATPSEKYPALLRIDEVAGMSVDEARQRPKFDEGTAIRPTATFALGHGKADDEAGTTGRLLDLLAPLGKGQRLLVSGPPRTGKTTTISHIAAGLQANHAEVELIVVLVDERPEEVTQVARSISTATLIGSTYDRPADEHVHVAELAIEVAKRRVEAGKDVVVVLEGVTRLARAYNAAAPSGRVVPGGIDAGSVHPTKRFLGAARALEEGGSLTVIATIPVDSGSGTDAVVYDEVRGGASSEVRLDRRLAERRRFPAFDVAATSTSAEAELLPKDAIEKGWALRRTVDDAKRTEGSEDAVHAALLAALS